MMAASELKVVNVNDERLTVGDKVVLHLGQYINAELDQFGMPYAMTQDEGGHIRHDRILQRIDESHNYLQEPGQGGHP